MRLQFPKVFTSLFEGDSRPFRFLKSLQSWRSCSPLSSAVRSRSPNVTVSVHTGTLSRRRAPLRISRRRSDLQCFEPFQPPIAGYPEHNRADPTQIHVSYARAYTMPWPSSPSTTVPRATRSPPVLRMRKLSPGQGQGGATGRTVMGPPDPPGLRRRRYRGPARSAHRRRSASASMTRALSAGSAVVTRMYPGPRRSSFSALMRTFWARIASANWHASCGAKSARKK